MSLVHITIDLAEQGRLRACWSCPQTATRYYAEFTDSLPGAVGLSAFVAMLQTATGYPVSVAIGTALIHSEAVRSVLAGNHPPVRFDGRYAVSATGGLNDEAANA